MQRFPTAKPTVMVGSTVMSGTPNTGQVLMTQGGTHLVSVASGVVGPDVAAWVGAGRLDSAFFHDSAIIALSGQPVFFYDAATAVSGGPLTNKVVGVLAPGAELGGTGISGAALRGGALKTFGTPFYSGLCYSLRSGQAGFSVCFTPVLSGTTINP